MNKETKFLLHYAKIGVLASLDSLDAIAKDELKTEFIRIKTKLTSNTEEITKKESKKDSAVRKWFSEIGDRQRAYRKEHKGEL